MNEDVKQVIEAMQAQMDRAITHLENELTKIRAGKASPQMLDGIYVDYYGANTPLSQVASVNSPDARTLSIQPWEKNMLGPIEKAIQAANLGLNPQNDGTVIRINVPPLTEERRKDLVRKCRAEGEHGKISLRTLRKEANDGVKKDVKKGITEDDTKEAEIKIQQLTDQYILKVDKHLDTKEKEIMTV